MWRISNVNDRVQKVKSKLLELGYIDNEWLAKYLEMIELNLATPRDRKRTQEHHAIPVNSYWTSDKPYNRQKALKLSKLDDTNFSVHLLYKDHLIIHSYLTLCTNLDAVQRRYEAQADLRKRNSQIGIAASIEKGTNTSSNDYTSVNIKVRKAKQRSTKNYVLQYYSAEDAEEILSL